MSDTPGTLMQKFDKTPYVDHLLTYIRPESWSNIKIVFNSGNGSAGAVIEQLVERLNVDPTFVHLEPNGGFQTVYRIHCWLTTEKVHLLP